MTTPDKELRAADLARLAELVAANDAAWAAWRAGNETEDDLQLLEFAEATQTALLDAAERDLPALLAMARRYAWLRDPAKYPRDGYRSGEKLLALEHLDAAIDAAMGAQP